MEPKGAVILMKAGPHARQTLEEILTDKIEQLESVGQTWWGYGGGCQPFKTVKPFAEASSGPVDVVFLETKSGPPNEPSPATEFSVDKKKWLPLPSGLTVKGSRYALVLKDLRRVDEDLDLASYKVAVGDHAGKRASDYLFWNVDKGCFRWAERGTVQPKLAKVAAVAQLAEPWAVFVR
jgi:hypothetical protein